MSNFFALLTDNICDNALDLANGMLIVGDHWYCQWLITAQDDNDYITLEFINFDVRKNIALKN